MRTVAGAVIGLVGTFYGFALFSLLCFNVVDPPVTMVQIQRRVEAVMAGDPYVHQYRPVSLAQMSRHVPRAVVAAEDGRFYQHRGFDWEELARARTEAERRGRPMRGASTITQQLVKNLFLTTHRSFLRKGIEYTLVPFAELLLTKDRILEIYLNVVEWAPGVYGIEAAARHHYNVPAGQLSRDQATRLAACLPAPRTRRPQNMGWYATIIGRRMAQMGW